MATLLDGTGPNTLYVYYQPRDLRLEVCDLPAQSCGSCARSSVPCWWLGWLGVPLHPLCPLREVVVSVVCPLLPSPTAIPPPHLTLGPLPLSPPFWNLTS